MSVVEEMLAAEDVAASGITVPTPPTGWMGWPGRVVRLMLACLKHGIAMVRPADKRTAGAVRMAEKERQKEIRRELRGLPPTQ